MNKRDKTERRVKYFHLSVDFLLLLCTVPLSNSSDKIEFLCLSFGFVLVADTWVILQPYRTEDRTEELAVCECDLKMPQEVKILYELEWQEEESTKFCTLWAMKCTELLLLHWETGFSTLSTAKTKESVKEYFYTHP